MCPTANQLPLRNQHLEQEQECRKASSPCPSINTQLLQVHRALLFMRACRQSMACSKFGPLAPFVLPQQVLTGDPRKARSGLSERAVEDPHIPRLVDAISCGDNVVDTSSDSVCCWTTSGFSTCSMMRTHTNWARLSRIDQIYACRNWC